MTKGNRVRMERIIRRLSEAVDQNDDASTLTMILYEAITNIMVVLNDLHFRPEINSEP